MRHLYTPHSQPPAHTLAIGREYQKKFGTTSPSIRPTSPPFTNHTIHHHHHHHHQPGSKSCSWCRQPRRRTRFRSGKSRGPADGGRHTERRGEPSSCASSCTCSKTRRCRASPGGQTRPGTVQSTRSRSELHHAVEGEEEQAMYGVEKKHVDGFAAGEQGSKTESDGKEPHHRTPGTHKHASCC